MPDDPRQEFSPLPTRDRDVRARPFPRAAYVFGWLAICLVAAEGINSVVSGLLGTGIILICLVPVMIWLMLIRPRRGAPRDRRG